MKAIREKDKIKKGRRPPDKTEPATAAELWQVGMARERRQ